MIHINPEIVGYGIILLGLGWMFGRSEGKRETKTRPAKEINLSVRRHRD